MSLRIKSSQTAPNTTPVRYYAPTATHLGVKTRRLTAVRLAYNTSVVSAAQYDVRYHKTRNENLETAARNGYITRSAAQGLTKRAGRPGVLFIEPKGHAHAHARLYIMYVYEQTGAGTSRCIAIWSN